jgi:hypothetical protein
MPRRTPPIIILGMHRSGTSMINGLLQRAGVFIGHRQLPSRQHEAVFFLRFNEWIFSQANATWDNVYNFQFIDDRFVTDVENGENSS